MTDHILQLGDDDYAHPIIHRRYHAPKTITLVPCNPDQAIAATILERVLALYREQPEFTIALVNTVKDAQTIAQGIRDAGIDCILIHSRFREPDKPDISTSRLANFTGIVVSTQSIECGVDLSARNMVTAIAPWESLVQRFGRCNRYGEYDASHIWVVDVPNTKVYPYRLEQIERSRETLATITSVSLCDLARIHVPISIAPTRTPDIESFADEFFHTDTDLQGSRTDISHYVRGIQDDSVNVVYRTFDTVQVKGKLRLEPDNGQVQPTEIVKVPIYKFWSFLGNKPVYRYSHAKRGYQEVRAKDCQVGELVIVHTRHGGYSAALGFTGNAADKLDEVEVQPIPHDTDDTDPSSHRISGYVTLRQHAIDAAAEARKLAHLVPKDLQPEYERACRWHDYGKAHTGWQSKIMAGDRLYAKAPKSGFNNNEGRKHIRHELASMLAARANGESILLQYLVLAHHGKVRTSIDLHPREKSTGASTFRGIADGDEVALPVDLGDGLVINPTTLELAGLTAWHGQWPQDVRSLLTQYGPFTLSYLEALVRIADWRASANPGEVHE